MLVTCSEHGPASPFVRIRVLSPQGQGTVGELTRFLSSTLHETVIDQTGLKGLFNYTLDINSYLTEEMRKSTGTGPPLEANSIIAQAMQEQLGLKVESKKTPVSVVVVEHIEKAPTEN